MEIGFRDALFATLSQLARRARGLAAGYAVAAAGFGAGVIALDAGLAWLAAAGAPPAAAVALVVLRTGRDFRGRRVRRMRYYLCGEGVEVRGAGGTDWIVWEDFWDVGETRRSFLLSPSPGEHYLIPKRCCGAALPRVRELLREAPETAGSRRRGSAQR